MEEKRIYCKLITPLFSFGADKNSAELRSAELKGAMRYTYRMICPSDTRQLAKDEAELFGGATGAKYGTGHISPVRVVMQGDDLRKGEKNLLLHRGGRQYLSCFLGGDIVITAHLSRPIVEKLPEALRPLDLNWYSDLIKLSLMICGMGRRSRKGRGCFQINDLTFANKQHMLEWFCQKLNNIAVVSSQEKDGYYEIQNNVISSKYIINCIKRPIIQKIIVGKMMRQGQVDHYLSVVDELCHQLKRGDLGLPSEITGNPNRQPKFASPLFIRIIQTEEGYYPLYIFVKGIRNGGEIDPQCTDREKFVEGVEKLWKGGNMK